MPLTDRSQAKESGFAQVRAALQKFEGTVASAEWGQWGGNLVDEEGNKIPPREFLEITNVDVEVLEVTEELVMPIEEWNFRVNVSEYKGSFWVEEFLASADKVKVLIPDDLVGKRVVWKKVTLVARDPKYNSTNFIIESIKGEVKAAPKVVKKAVSPVEVVEAEAEEAPTEGNDPMEVAFELAVGKTEQQFRTAISLDPRFANSPLLPMAKAGVITQSLVNDGKLVLVNNKYQKPD